MIYITSRRNKNRNLTEKHIDAFFEQFNKSRRSVMSGHILFTRDLTRYVSEVLSRNDLPEEQENLIARAGSLIEYLTENFLDSLTELYASEAEDINPGNLDEASLFITGYRNGLDHYRETTYSILEKSTFKGKENAMAKSFYMALGLELADHLKYYMIKPESLTLPTNEFGGFLLQ